MASIFIVFADEVGHIFLQITAEFGYPGFSELSYYPILCREYYDCRLVPALLMDNIVDICVHYLRTQLRPTRIRCWN